MNLFGSPVLKVRTSDRLHIAKEPAFMSWATVVTFLFLASGISYYLIPEYFVIPAVFLMLCLLLSLNLMEAWDLIMDKDENLVTLVTRTWYHGFSMKVPEENVKRFPLSSIKSVHLNSDSSIDIIKNDRSCTTIKMEGQDLRSVRNLRKEMTTFLYLERIEYLKGKSSVFHSWDFDPWSVMEWSESQDADADIPEDINSRQQESHYEYGRNIKEEKDLLHFDWLERRVIHGYYLDLKKKQFICPTCKALPSYLVSLDPLTHT